MYPDPKRVRNNKHTIRFDDYEEAVLTALANYQGEQLAVMIREIVMREATAVLAERNSSILTRAGA
ncbi:hypothetical protein WS62_24235 [Burkholderia sp. ABCPW 14]|uniref:Gp11 n=1 Tax=Burkholderia oklahomensis TaxID=342113 RepID=A0AAI8B3J6_9BURK|nr:MULTISPECIES: hypothetical protein [Burkholderia]AIO65027.1 putative gp11 [Burkholderia oklahomensis]AOI43973.1 hypothetical protein WG70_31490 [Burkholderia oklahomensis EO147]ARK88515.1 hypothetical protein BOC42_15055 [Burkholderia pseudomallei]KUY52492.1 hypothetical protein WG70_14615 [Burkholderia oklahomensis EO147]KVD81695.1 hypothetical protein WS62_24235 [Burkholderia sp. ABCPW 14]